MHGLYIPIFFVLVSAACIKKDMQKSKNGELQQNIWTLFFFYSFGNHFEGLSHCKLYKMAMMPKLT